MNGAEGLAAFALFAAIGLIGVTLAKGFAQRIAGGGHASRELDDLREEVAQLRAELDGLHARLGDVEELQNRLDFAERMLAQLNDRPALPGSA